LAFSVLLGVTPYTPSISLYTAGTRVLPPSTSTETMSLGCRPVGQTDRQQQQQQQQQQCVSTQAHKITQTQQSSASMHCRLHTGAHGTIGIVHPPPPAAFDERQGPHGIRQAGSWAVQALSRVCTIQGCVCVCVLGGGLSSETQKCQCPHNSIEPPYLSSPVCA
jgi:hypothetical protein